MFSPGAFQLPNDDIQRLRNPFYTEFIFRTIINSKNWPQNFNFNLISENSARKNKPTSMNFFVSSKIFPVYCRVNDKSSI